jgi:hypothetical protein
MRYFGKKYDRPIRAQRARKITNPGVWHGDAFRHLRERTWYHVRALCRAKSRTNTRNNVMGSGGIARICGSSGLSGCFPVTREEMSVTFSGMALETNRANRFNRN